MHAKCPNCGTKIDWREHSRSSDLREIVNLLPQFGPDYKVVYEYVELFGVDPVSLKTKKFARLLREMAALYQSGKFTLQKTVYEISRPGIAEALRETCNRQFQAALTNHNYLKKVMIQIAERERKERSKSDERRLRQRETALIQGERREDPMPDHDTAVKNIKGILETL